MNAYVACVNMQLFSETFINFNGGQFVTKNQVKTSEENVSVQPVHKQTILTLEVVLEIYLKKSALV